MDEERKILLQKFLLSKGLIWGGQYRLIDNMTGINCYEVAMNDTNRDTMMEGSICENDLMLTICENFTNDYDSNIENEMVYDFSYDWTRYLLRNSKHREIVEQEIVDLIEQIGNKMAADIAEVQFNYEMDLEKIERKATKEIEIYEEMLNESKEHTPDFVQIQ